MYAKRSRTMLPLSKSVSMVENLFETVELRRKWSSVVGETLSQKTYVKKFEQGKLILGVEHSGWAQQLNMMKKQLIEKISLQTTLAIKDITWVFETNIPEIKQYDVKPVRNKFRKATSSNAQDSLHDILKRVRDLSIDLQK